MSKAPVSLKQCETYDLSLVTEQLISALSDLGGLGSFVAPGEKILLKTNLLGKHAPEEGVTTHPVVVEALARILIEHGCEVVIGDSPGGPFTENSLRAIYKTSGMEEVAARTGATLNFNTTVIHKENPKGEILLNIAMVGMLADVDKVISVSKFKTHKMMTFTGAIKNLFGTIPGVMKAEYHLNMKDYDTFANALVDICLCADPVLSIMDGVVAMEGEGPSAGSLRTVGALIASPSPWHLDKVACSLIGLESSRVPVLKACARRGLCSADLSDVTLFGVDPEAMRVADFVIPESNLFNMTVTSNKLVNTLFNVFVQPKPVFDHKGCVGCAICAQNCPAKAIKMVDQRPHVDLKACIRCYCCQELCPEHVVEVHRSALLRKLSGA